MNMTEIREKAKGLGLKSGKLTRGDLIRAIQRKEGNFACFETAKDYCDQMLCCWRDACLPTKKTLSDWEKKKDLYLDKLAAELADLKKQLTDLDKKARKIAGKGQKEVLAEIGTFQEKMRSIKKDSRKIIASGEKAWDSSREKIDAAWNDLSKAVKKAAGKFK